jgi:hypothetical protein
VTCSRDGGESAERIGIVPYDIVHGALGTSRRRLMNVRSSTLDATPNFRQIGHSNAVDQFAETYPGVSLGYNIRRHFDHCGGVGDSQATASEFEQCRVVFTSPIETTFPAGIPSSSRLRSDGRRRRGMRMAFHPRLAAADSVSLGRLPQYGQAP